MSTIKDVAEKANVSIATVSRYFRARDIVSPTTQLRIQHAVNDLGYTPNTLASNLKSSRTNTIGLVIGETDNAFFNHLIQSLSASLAKLGKRLIVLYSEPSAKFTDQLRTLISFRVEAIIFIPTRFSASIAHLLAQETCYPLQLFIDCFPSFDSLTVDDSLGAALATRELMRHGHRRILLVDVDNAVYRKRREGMSAELRSAGIPCGEENFLALPETDYRRRQELIADAVERFRPTAVLSVTNSLTQNVVRVLDQRNLRESVSLIMYDDSEWAEFNDLTVVSHPMIEMTDLIQTVLLQNLYRPSVPSRPRKLVVKPILIARKSVKQI